MVALKGTDKVYTGVRYCLGNAFVCFHKLRHFISAFVVVFTKGRWSHTPYIDYTGYEVMASTSYVVHYCIQKKQ